MKRCVHTGCDSIHCPWLHKYRRQQQQQQQQQQLLAPWRSTAYRHSMYGSRFHMCWCHAPMHLAGTLQRLELQVLTGVSRTPVPRRLQEAKGKFQDLQKIYAVLGDAEK
jgi:hypothetical protein